MSEQVAHRGYRDFILADNQNPTRHGPDQPGVADPALRRGIALDDLLRCLLMSTILYLSVTVRGEKHCY